MSQVGNGGICDKKKHMCYRYSIKTKQLVMASSNKQNKLCLVWRELLTFASCVSKVSEKK